MTEFLILLRHGIAHPPGTMPEETRGLTAEGHERMKEIARGLKRIRPNIDVIYSSPLLRAMQTAQYVSDRYQLNVFFAPELRPDAKARELRDLLNRTTARIVLCVGHEPTLSKMMCEITKTRGGTFELKKGGCYGIRIDGDDSRLEWMLSPRVLRR